MYMYICNFNHQGDIAVLMCARVMNLQQILKHLKRKNLSSHLWLPLTKVDYKFFSDKGTGKHSKKQTNKDHTHTLDKI